MPADIMNGIQALPFITQADVNMMLPEPSNLLGQFQKWQRTTDFTGTVSNLRSFADNLEKQKDSKKDTALNFLEKIEKNLGTPEERGNKFDAIQKELQKGNEINTQIAENTSKTAARIGSFTTGTLARVLSNIAEDAYLGLVGN